MAESKLVFRKPDWDFAPTGVRDVVLAHSVSTRVSESGKADCILLGLPFDGAVLGRKGAAEGPAALRAAAKSLKAHSFHSGPVHKHVCDLGDVQLPAQDVARAHALSERAVRFAIEKNSSARIVALGGDHSLAFPCVLPYLESHGDALAVINLDAHLDVRRVVPGKPPNSGTGFGRLIESGLKHYTVIGARDFQTSTHYVNRVRSAAGTIITADDVLARGGQRVAREVLKSLPRKCRAIYLSVDLDVADASVAPGVSAPTPGGLFAHHVFDLVRLICSDRRTAGCGIFELAPKLEAPNSDRTARLGAACLAFMIASA